MNEQSAVMIDNLISDKPYLKSKLMYQRGFEFVKAVLLMPEWKESKFQGLLTSNIWNSNIETIEAVLAMPEWEEAKLQSLLTPTIWSSSYTAIKQKIDMPLLNDKRYQHLLVPSIFAISINNIVNGISLLEKFNLDQYVTIQSLRLKTDYLEFLIEYMITNKIDLVIDNQSGKTVLNPILNASRTALKEKYGIDIKKLYEESKREAIKNVGCK